MELEDPEEREDIVNNCGAGSLLTPEIEKDDKKDSLNDCIVINKLMLINGRLLELVLNSQQQQAAENQITVTQGGGTQSRH